MKNKVFNLLAVSVFMVSLFSMTSYDREFDYTNCFELADIGTNNADCTFEELTGHQMSHQQRYNFWERLYNHCTSQQGSQQSSQQNVLQQ